MATTVLIAPTAAAATAALGTNPTFAAPVAVTLTPDGATPLDQFANADIQKQDANTQWSTIASLGISQRQLILQTSGTYRVVKGASTVAFGVDLDT